MKKGNRKFGQVALAGVIAFGGLGVGAVADIPIPGFKAEQAEAAMLYQHIDFYNNAKNSIDHSYSFQVDSTASHAGRTADWYVKDLGANVKLRGTSTIASSSNQGSGVTSWGTKSVRTDLSSLTVGTYELLYIYTAGGEEHRKSIYFQKSSDGSIDTH